MLYSSNGGGMSGQKNDAAGSVGFFRQSLCDLFFFALVVDIEMGEDALHLWQGRSLCPMARYRKVKNAHIFI